MANNEQMYCNICKRETTFFLESDLLWYCNDCDQVRGSYPILRDEDIKEELEEFEDENGESVYCKSCGNFNVIVDIIEDNLCENCMEELCIQLEKKGYIFDEERDRYIKEIEE